MNITAQPASPAPVFVPPTAEVEQAMVVATSSFKMAQAIIVDSPEGYEASASDLVDLRARWKRIEAVRVHLKEPYLEGGRRIDEFFKPPLERLEQAASMLKARMLEYKTAEDLRVEEARQAEEARRRAEREAQEKLQREAAERDAIARAKAEQADREAAAAVAKAKADGDADAARLVEARAAEARAKADAQSLAAQQAADAAQTAMDLADLAPATSVVTSGAQAHGISGRKTWVVESIDKRALVLAAAKLILDSDDEMLLAFLRVDEQALGTIAKGLKGAARVPGVVFREKMTLATTGRR